MITILSILGCAQIPEGVEPINEFNAQQYLGTWYEIARLDHWFERGLINVSANYSPREDGGINVVNRGFDPESNEWKEAEGRAYFVVSPNVGRLKVSFFRPFYGGYNIIDLDTKDYSYSLVCGNNRDYLWILSRTPQMSEGIWNRLLEKAKKLDFNTSELIFVQQMDSK